MATVKNEVSFKNRFSEIMAQNWREIIFKGLRFYKELGIS